VGSPCSPVSATPFPYIKVYIATFEVIIWSIKFRNIITDKVNMRIFTCDVGVFQQTFYYYSLNVHLLKNRGLSGRGGSRGPDPPARTRTTREIDANLGRFLEGSRGS